MQFLDTTIRDGSYAVDFKFSSRDVTEIVRRLNRLGFKYIEIGHGLGLNGSSPENGLSLQTDLEYMTAAYQSAGNSKIGFFCIPGIARMEDLVLASQNCVSFIRIGENAADIDNVRTYVEQAKKLGLLVAVNFMKSYTITPEAFAEKAKAVKAYGADCVYLVDSSGGMLPEQVKEYYLRTKDKCDVKIGFHAHNNLGLAVSNSLLAIELGFDYIDTTMQGIGRSVGNAMAEELIMALEKRSINTGFDIPRLLEYGYYINQNIAKRTAVNPLDLMCGYADFHSSNLKYIYKCCSEAQVDPLRLILAYSTVNKKNVDYEELCAVAKTLPKDYDENPYDFRKFFISGYHE